MARGSPVSTSTTTRALLDVLAHLVGAPLAGLGVLLVALLLQGDAVLQRALHGLLELDVYGEVDVVAGHGVLGVGGVGYGALALRVTRPAVRAVQPASKASSRRLADLGVVV